MPLVKEVLKCLEKNLHLLKWVQHRTNKVQVNLKNQKVSAAVGNKQSMEMVPIDKTWQDNLNISRM